MYPETAAYFICVLIVVVVSLLFAAAVAVVRVLSGLIGRKEKKNVQ